MELSAALAVFGAELRSNEPTFSQYSLELSNLSEWTGFRPIRPLGHTEQFDGGVTYKSPERLPADCGVGIVELSSASSSKMGVREFSIAHRDVFALRPTSPLSIDDVQKRMIRPLRYFLALATGSLPDIVRLDALKKTRSSHWPWRAVRLYQTSRAPQAEKVYNHQMPLPLEGLDFPVILPAWFRIFQQMSGPCDLLFDRTSGFISNRFFDVATAAEGMHHALLGSKSRATPQEKYRIAEAVKHLPEVDREWVRSRLGQSFGPSFEIRLLELRAVAGDSGYLYTQGGGLGGIEAWSALAAEYRNRIAHSRDIEAINWSDLAHLEWSISGLLRLVLLR